MSEQGTGLPVISAIQQPLWVLYKANPTDPANEHVLAVEVRGDFDVSRGEEAFRAVLNKHKHLYAVFRSSAAGVCQVPFDPGQARIAEKPAGNATSQEILVGLLGEITNPETAPPVAITLVRLDDDRALLLFRAHRLVMDRVSFARFLDLFSEHYGRVHQYRQTDPGHTTAKAQETPVVQKVAQLFSSLPGELDIPDDFLYSLSGRRTAITDVSLPIASVERVTSFVRDSGESAQALFLAVYAMLLHAYSGGKDLIIGVPWPTEAADQLAQATNVVPIRIAIDGNEKFTAFCATVGRLLEQANERRELPFAQLCSELCLGGSPADVPLIHSALNCYQVIESSSLSRLLCPGAPEASLGGLACARLFMSPEDRLTRFDMDTVSSVNSMRFSVRYDPSRISANRALSFARHMRSLLDVVLTDPQLPLYMYDYLPDVERARVAEFSEPVARTSDAVPVWQMIEDVASRQPESSALRRRGQVVTYAELWHRVRGMAALIEQSAVRQGDLVALIAEPSVELVVWMLALHRAGCAYLPLDTATPVKRLLAILDDAECRVVVVDPTASEIMAAMHDRQLFDIRDTQPDTELAPTNPGASTDDVAYVIYTSGSTGRPKGVLVPHRGMTNHCEGVLDAFQLQSSDRILQFASPSFDVAAEEIFPTLAAGATLVLRDTLAVAPSSLCDLAEAEEITVLNLPTSYWVEWVKWLHHSGKQFPETVRLVIIGGEEVLPSAVRQWFTLGVPDVRLINAYGPTETTISPVLGEVCPADIESGQRVPIGRPLPNIGATVVDTLGRPVGVGVPGELLLSGPCVAKGYLGQPGKTDEVFKGNDPATRIYQTGDIVRWRFDGKLEFIGRNDSQVQIRGFRIELAEIEARLLEYPDVRAAAVVCDKPGTESAALIGWVSSGGGQEADTAAIRSWLGSLLPYYMVPNRIISMAALPMTASGKIDRKRLGANSDPDQVFAAEAPIGRKEEALAEIWQSVLGVTSCDRMSSFIDQGGQSILALEVIEKAALVFVAAPGLDSLLSDTLAQVASGLELKCEVSSGTPQRRTPDSSNISPASSRPRIAPLLAGDTASAVYAVHYEPPLAVACRGAALICPPYGHEYVRTHRAITRLCESLAHAGCHALKFDYFGTGDSAGDSGTGGIERWIADIQIAAGELKRRAGIDKPHIIGLRLGAMLAIAAPIQVAKAVWVDPVLSGRSYVDGLEQLERSLRTSNESLVIPGKATDLVGMPWPAALRREIREHSTAMCQSLVFEQQCCVLSSDFVEADVAELRRSIGESGFVRPGFETPWKHLNNRAEELITREVISSISSELLEPA